MQIDASRRDSPAKSQTATVEPRSPVGTIAADRETCLGTEDAMVLKIMVSRGDVDVNFKANEIIGLSIFNVKFKFAQIRF